MKFSHRSCNRQRQPLFTGIFILWLMAALVSAKALYASPQYSRSPQTKNPILQITHIDTTRFPHVEIYVQGENLGAALDGIPLTLKEDDREQEVISSQFSPVGVQLALMAAIPGREAGNESYPGIGEAARRLINLGLLSPTTDRLAAWAAVDSSNMGELQPWSTNHGQAAEALARYRPADGSQKQTLFDMLDMALDRFEQPDVPPHLKKTVVLFSNGLDNGSARTLADVLDRAAAKNITLHTVLVGPPAGPGQSNLQRLAARTGGQFMVLNSAQDLDALWQTIAGTRNQRVLTYRSGQKRSWQVTVMAYLPNGSMIQAEKRFPPLQLQPVQINIPQAKNHTLTVDPNKDSVTTPSGEAMLELPLEFLWPDGYERAILKIEYTLDNSDTRVQDTPPFSPLLIPADALKPGTHSLRIEATDELGISGESYPVSLRNTAAYAAPSLLMLVLWGGGVLLGSGLAGGGYYWFYLKPKREAAAKANTPVASGASLAVEDKKTNKQQTFPLTTGNNPIGRSRSNKIFIENAQISREHCLIRYEKGYHKVVDLGSKLGTFVNDQRLEPHREHMLAHNDIIKLGKSVVCRFYLAPTGKPGPANRPKNDTLYYVG